MSASSTKIFVIALLVLLIQSQENPAPPVWPNQWEQTFEEEMAIGPIKGKTTGKMFYDWSNNRYLITRVSGENDRYCMSVEKFSNTACNHLVVGGKRYLDFPQKSYCCHCCDADHGCGLVKPDWLAPAVFKGYVSDQGVKYQNWYLKGGQDNFYWATDDAHQTMRKIDMQPNDLFNFDVKSYKEGITDPSVFNFPSYGCSKDCTIFSVCGALRAGIN